MVKALQLLKIVAEGVGRTKDSHAHFHYQSAIRVNLYLFSELLRQITRVPKLALESRLRIAVHPLVFSRHRSYTL